MLFFGSRCDRLCMLQYSLISLIPGLLRNLQDCADPELNSFEEARSQPTSLQSSNRSSLLSFMGLPLQIFGKASAPPPLPARPCPRRPGLTRLPGELLRPLHAPPAARRPGRLWHQVVPGWQHKLAAAAATGPLQRHTRQPRRRHHQHHVSLAQVGPRPDGGRPTVDRLPDARDQRDVGRGEPKPPQDDAVRGQRGVYPLAV